MMIAKRFTFLLLAAACGGKGAQGTTPDPAEDDCYKCHDNYDRGIGGVPKESLAAPAGSASH